jgi:site-specific DNA-cytosine methylase
LIRLDLYRHFKGAAVLDLFAGACGWLMALYFWQDHYWPREWIAVDIDARRLQICRLVGREMGVDVVAVRRDLSRPYAPPYHVDVVVGSPPCHEFSAATVARKRHVGEGLRLVESYAETVRALDPQLAVMEIAVTTSGSPRLVGAMLARRGFSLRVYDLRDFGAIQYRRRRLIAWRAREGRGREELTVPYIISCRP